MKRNGTSAHRWRVRELIRPLTGSTAQRQRSEFSSVYCCHSAAVEDRLGLTRYSTARPRVRSDPTRVLAVTLIPPLTDDGDISHPEMENSFGCQNWKKQNLSFNLSTCTHTHTHTHTHLHTHTPAHTHTHSGRLQVPSAAADPTVTFSDSPLVTQI